MLSNDGVVEVLSMTRIAQPEMRVGCWLHPYVGSDILQVLYLYTNQQIITDLDFPILVRKSTY